MSESECHSYRNAVPPPPPPPRIRPESPSSQDIELSDIDSDSDISSLPEVQSDANLNITENDKLEEVSDNELDDIDDSVHNTKESTVELETIESDEDLPEDDKQTSLSELNSTHLKSLTCDKCHLHFVNAESLSNHINSESHEFVANGFKESLGMHSCLVCLTGFQSLSELREHQESQSHKQQYDALGIESQSTQPEQCSSPTRKRSRSTSFDLPMSKRQNGEVGEETSPVCNTCQIVFNTDHDLHKHIKSQQHSAMEEGRRPKILWPANKCDEGPEENFCQLCWLAFENIDELCLHYSHRCHLRMIKNHGVFKILNEKRSPTGGDSTKVIAWDNYIVLDEVGQCDGDSPHTNGHPYDQLESVSSDEDIALEPQRVADSLKPLPLEDVNSSDDEFVLDPVSDREDELHSHCVDVEMNSKNDSNNRNVPANNSQLDTRIEL